MKSKSEASNREVDLFSKKMKKMDNCNSKSKQEWEKFDDCNNNFNRVVKKMNKWWLQKDAVMQAMEELLQEKEREIRELQLKVREREESSEATGSLKLKWRDGPPTPFATK